MHPFELRGAGASSLELAADPVLHRLDVVIGARLDGLDRRDVGRRRIGRERLEPAARGLRQRGEHRGRRPLRQRQQPGAFHTHALAHQTRLAEHAAHRRELGGIAAIQRRESVYGGRWRDLDGWTQGYDR